MPDETGPAPPPAARPRRGRLRLLAVAAALFVIAAAGIPLARRIGGFSLFAPSPPRVTHDLVMQQVVAVAKLVASEATVRDVVTFENTYLGSTKRTLLVVTGKVSAGIDLSKGADVAVDDAAKRITVTLPPAEVLGVEVLNLRTYDERAGLWNPFRPADRDAINAQVREQLLRAGRESGLVEHANRSAAATLRALLARDGYTVDVRTTGTVTTPAAR